MCGIAGVAASGATPRSEDAVQRMLTAMAHRGPDDAHAVSRASVEIGAVRLAVMDPTPTGRQPLGGCGERIVVALNGEIYNHATLLTELQGLGHDFVGTSDTEVVAHAWEQWGEAVLARLCGMFGLAVYDTELDVLTLARDRCGEKPLYWALAGNGFAFASEARALMAAGYGAGLDEGSLAAFARFGSVRGERTLYQGIRALPPGHLQRVASAGPQPSQSFLSRSAGTTTGSGRLQGDDRLSDILDSALLEAGRSDVPTALCLSGGLDSAIMAAVLRGTETLEAAYTLVFDQVDYDESVQAQATADLNDIPLTRIVVGAEDWVPSLEAFVSALDQPSVDGFNLFLVTRQISEKYKVAFTGVGADEAFGGYSTFRYLRLPQAPGWISRAARRPLQAAIARWPGSRYLKAADVMLQASPLGESYDRLRELDPRLRAMLATAADPAPPWPSSAPKSEPLMRQVADLEFTRYLVDTLLRDADCVSMANSVELRAPFLHPTVVAVGLQHIASMEAGAAGKELLRELYKSRLAEHLQHPARKRGFAVPVGWWLTSPEGKAYVHDRLDARTWREQGLFTPESREPLLSLLESDMSSPARYRQYLAVFGALVLTMWWDLYGR